MSEERASFTRMDQSTNAEWMTIGRATIDLQPLVDKGKKVDPPESHLNKSLRDEWKCVTLWDVSDLALAFLEGKIAEAKAQFS